MWQSSLSPQELEFFASLKTQVTIIPNFSTSGEIFLLSVPLCLGRARWVHLRQG